MAMLSPGRLPPGLRVYAIGDVHGCAARLTALHAAIAADWAVLPGERCAVVHLGDYIDRGPDSAAVLNRLLQPPPVAGAESVLLRGNHEAMMLEALAAGRGTAAEDLWLANGGRATLRSYGRAGPPPAHLALMQGTGLFWQAGSYLFVHAGLDPRRPLAAQREQDLLWIREPFLSWPDPLEQVVVHGHTPSRAPEVRRHRIGIDTGAVGGGPLTGLVLEADTLRFLSA
ncbi:metallophosphoesterase family protein [Teichococcus vastitatis]|uniref:Serine/threonine protein phosphatase n=1 Tax=Teichococcus vastitatis TaxID=2307076 RepID=A0ABS9W5A2_9PROT|nr:metallophosphoesterase family protein [Pseudoroseomonas vastitatis]MCI0754473.1 serine/threonine protein phosphatase [Pseudoroseomonas vastitatis]